MAYVDIPDSDLDLNSPGKEGDVFQQMRDNINALRVFYFGLTFGPFNSTSGTFVTVTNSTFYVRTPDIPDYTGIDRKVITNVLCKVSGGATAEVRVVQVTDATNGTAVSFTDATDTAKSPELDTDNAWLDIAKEYRLEARISSGAGTVTITATDRYGSEIYF